MQFQTKGGISDGAIRVTYIRTTIVGELFLADPNKDDSFSCARIHSASTIYPGSTAG